MTIHYTGGYFLHNEPLVRTHGGNGHTANDLSELSNYTVESVNHVQETPWQVNPFVLDVVKSFFDEDRDATLKKPSGTEIVLRVKEPVDPWEKSSLPEMQQLPKDVWDSMDKAQRKKFKEKRANTLTRYEEQLGVYRATKRIFNEAMEMSEFHHFFFPHNLCFRTRLYPIPTDMTPQSNDLSKGLLRFARPKELGPNGLEALGFIVATHWGLDKKHPNDRTFWSRMHLSWIESIVDDPYTNQDWLKADKPFQFLGAANDWVWANRSDNPETYLCKTPANLDGSCNGAQHLSILARDNVGAEATNCRSIKSRNDLYQDVGDRAWEQVQKDAAEGSSLALEWVPKMMEPASRRDVVKRSVMTVPYGVTGYGVADFMIKEHIDATQVDSKWDSAKYMRDIIIASIDNTLANGRKLQLWFSACAQICAQNGQPLVWITPAGSKVTQAYRDLIAKRVKCFNTRFYIYEEPTEDEIEEDFLGRVGMDEKRMATAAPPNVVHSCDASHLQITVCRMADEGMKDFSMIHDSFGTHCADLWRMRDILREAIVDMYREDYLQKWKADVEYFSGLEMPEPPALGDFDITEILDSDFFFS